MGSIKEVAALAGVSVPTVYKAFSNTYYTSPEIRLRVYEAAKKLNYVPKSLKNRNSKEEPKTLAVLLDQIVNPFYSRMLEEATKQFAHTGYRLMVFFNDENAAAEKINFDLALSHKCDGIIFVPTPDGDDDMVQTLAEKNFPMLQLFRTVHTQLDTLLIDDQLGTYLAVKHLIQSGHKKIMLVSKTNSALIKREVGYKRAFDEAGYEVNDEFLYLISYSECNKEMIKQKVKKLSPTAILSVGENTSVNVLQALKEMNLAIPEDISLIIYDDLPWAAPYGITTVTHSYETLAKMIADMVDKLFFPEKKGEEVGPARIVLDPMLIARDSVKIIK
ncbi:MAG TPA: LacI family transcriptional regulator [Candidatus Blautia faecavium]|uniref:LacI family transcriptional regulator n=1 Tax=Candidatus Blautia faecavium TaxID=2838487 RepID=A0A9D2RWA2_9FIRM|nr:LacI family transcriptional regulator [Candidatus Blautia faecavium]